jgi:CubicO group peptidase (beta-lactamase class C family)
MLLNGGELDGARILQAATVKLMTQDHLGQIPSADWVKDAGFGLGFAVVGAAPPTPGSGLTPGTR